MNDNIFSAEYNKLNSQQKQAVNEIEGPVMVIAGPGTGKTQILAMRIANILKITQTNPTNILCLTFTNSGAQAMKERLLKIIGPPAYQVQVHTFHAFCNLIISSFPEKFLTARKINQLDELEQIVLIQTILKNHHFNFLKPLKSPYYYQGAIIQAINQLKQENITPEIFLKVLKNEEELFLKTKMKLSKAKFEEKNNQNQKNKELAKIYDLYQKQLLKTGKYDYNDMILFVLNGLKNDSELLSYYQEKFLYILVDEYQDANSAQNEIVKIIASFHDFPNVFVVGDDEQSIFRFQGASMENILSFKKDYPETKIVILKNNYRSGQNILDASREVIKNNKNQIFNRLNITKILTSQANIFPGSFKIGEFSNGSVENYFVAQEILSLINKGHIPSSEIAVIYRENRDSEELINYFSNLKIPYQLEVGENVLDDPEIDKLITFFKVLNASDQLEDNQNLLEVMHYPFFNLRPLDIYKIISRASKQKTSIFNILTSETKSLNLENSKLINKFVKLILDSRKVVYNNTFTSAFEILINHTGYLDYLLSREDSVRHLNRLQTLFKYIQYLNLKENKLNLNKFLAQLELLQENNLKIKEEEVDGQFDGVRLMTAHRAKGIEFEIVFIVHLSDNHWGNKQVRKLIKLPHFIASSYDIDNDEEERRLFYVALTRAKKFVYLTYARAYGDIENQTFTLPSKFISELPSKYQTKINSKNIEQQFVKRLKLKFKTSKKPSKNMTEFLKNILVDFKLSPTALNSFLECPQRFFYDNILHVPKAKTFSQSYGTAIHLALEKYFLKFKKDLILPPKSYLISWFKNGLKEEILNPTDYQRAITAGSKVLGKYFQEYNLTWKKIGAPISCEYNFGYHNVYFNKVPLTGRIDKIELIDLISNKVRLIDYKTSVPKSLNQIMGLTKDKDLSLFYQAYFYKLLTETDPLFNWQVGEIVFDFISDRGFKQVVVKIDNKKYLEFKKLVLQTYHDITALKFKPNLSVCKKKNRTCDYFGICQNKT